MKTSRFDGGPRGQERGIITLRFFRKSGIRGVNGQLGERTEDGEASLFQAVGGTDGKTENAPRSDLGASLAAP